MSTSEAVTHSIRVRVEAEYSPERSSPTSQHWFFLYTVTISNEGDATVQLMTRHWVITDGNNHVEEVKGTGRGRRTAGAGPGRVVHLHVGLSACRRRTE